MHVIFLMFVEHWIMPVWNPSLFHSKNFCHISIHKRTETNARTTRTNTAGLIQPTTTQFVTNGSRSDSQFFRTYTICARDFPIPLLFGLLSRTFLLSVMHRLCNSCQHTGTNTHSKMRLVGSKRLTQPLRLHSQYKNLRSSGQPCTRKALELSFALTRARQQCISIIIPRVWTRTLLARKARVSSLRRIWTTDEFY